ncbi:MAG: type IV pilus modification PilV family protein [Candidatus Binataceae bacterium]
MKRLRTRLVAAFTLLEVMLAIAVIGIALIALLALQHSDLRAVIRGQELTRAAMLAQALMSEAELERFPAPGQTHGDFSQLYPGEYPNFQWARTVTPSPLFPDVTRVRVRVLYGPGFHNSFSLTEFMHNPVPPAPDSSLGGPGGNAGPGSNGPGRANQSG